MINKSTADNTRETNGDKTDTGNAENDNETRLMYVRTYVLEEEIRKQEEEEKHEKRTKTD